MIIREQREESSQLPPLRHLIKMQWGARSLEGCLFCGEMKTAARQPAGSPGGLHVGSPVQCEVKWFCLLLLLFVSLVKDPSQGTCPGSFPCITTEQNRSGCLAAACTASQGLWGRSLKKKFPKYENIWSSCNCRSCNKR